MTDNGLILQGIGGFYYVETADGVFECKAKGKFRKEKRIPLAGDRVRITVRDGKNKTVIENAEIAVSKEQMRNETGILLNPYMMRNLEWVKK